MQLPETQITPTRTPTQPIEHHIDERGHVDTAREYEAKINQIIAPSAAHQIDQADRPNLLVSRRKRRTRRANRH